MKATNKQTSKKQRERHVTFCAVADYAVKGSQAERETIQFLLNSLQGDTVGDYRLLVNYDIMERGNGNSLEVDIVVINRLGVFLLEIKDWRGSIEAFDDVWVFRGTQRRKNAWKSIDRKAKILYSQLFDKSGAFPHLSQVSVIGMVVLTRGLRAFTSHGNDNTHRIVDLSAALTEALSTTALLHRGNRSRWLSDAEIQAITKALYEQHQPHEVIVHNYRVTRALAFRDLCDTFEAQHTQIATRRVRLKRYQLPSLDQAAMEISIHHFQRSVQAVSALGFHPHLLATLDFFADDIRQQQDVFYEITELPTGPGLDEVMRSRAQQGQPLSLAEQRAFLEALSLALQHAHNHKDEHGKPDPVYHRNICRETVFQMQDGTIKLGDFDFAKFGDQTISVPGQTLIAKPYTAPELLKNSSQASARSDIYALGVLWYFMASLPAELDTFDRANIDALPLPEQARALLKRMTAEDPQQRPARIEEVLRALSSLDQRR